jgi:hypothetical protein
VPIKAHRGDEKEVRLPAGEVKGAPPAGGSYLSVHTSYGVVTGGGERQRYSARSFRDGQSNTVNLVVTTSALFVSNSCFLARPLRLSSTGIVATF